MFCTDALMQVCEELSIDIQTVKQAESLRRFNLSTNITVRQIKKLSSATLVSLSESISGGLNLQIGFPETLPLIKINKERVTDEEIEEISGALNKICQRNENLELRITITIDKPLLAEKLGYAEDRINLILYFFKDNLLSFLKSPLTELDAHLFTDPYKPITIIVAGHEFDYEGPLLTIVSSKNVVDAQIQEASKINSRLKERIDSYRTIASDNLSWSGFQLNRLTPIHFLCQRKTGEENDIDIILKQHLLHLFILFTANRSTIKGDYFLSTFAGSDNVAVLKLETHHRLSVEQNFLSRIAIWPISGKAMDRLTIFQTVVARESDSDNPSQNYENFLLRLPHLVNESNWHHRIFLNGEINKHFGQMETVTNFVYGVTNEVSQAVDSVTKSFVDTLLATVGVIVLTLLASLVKNETQGIIFQIGMLSYALYLLFFQVFYRLGNIYHSYVLLQNETDLRLKTYTQKLGRKRILELISPLSQRQRQFQFWFWLTVGFYVLVIFGISALGYVLPQYLQQIGVVNLDPSSIPNPLPPITPTP